MKSTIEIFNSWRYVFSPTKFGLLFCRQTLKKRTEHTYNIETTKQFIENWFLCGKQTPLYWQANRNTEALIWCLKPYEHVQVEAKNRTDEKLWIKCAVCSYEMVNWLLNLQWLDIVCWLIVTTNKLLRDASITVQTLSKQLLWNSSCCILYIQNIYCIIKFTLVCDSYVNIEKVCN